MPISPHHGRACQRCTDEQRAPSASQTCSASQCKQQVKREKKLVYGMIPLASPGWAASAGPPLDRRDAARRSRSQAASYSELASHVGLRLGGRGVPSPQLMVALVNSTFGCAACWGGEEVRAAEGRFLRVMKLAQCRRRTVCVCFSLSSECAGNPFARGIRVDKSSRVPQWSFYVSILRGGEEEEEEWV